ncbi:MAG: hypothetical protein Q4Q23_06220 [Methanobacteriaceae archaeon]|nr:hypothetical protein [Methanobacteriaceae archaeon]
MSKENIEDMIFKDLIKSETRFLEIIGIKEELTKCLNKELEVIPNKTLHPDLVFDTKEGKLIHIEFQSTYNLNENYRRFAAYNGLLSLTYNKNVETTIIYTCNTKNIKKELKLGSITFKPNIITYKNKNSDELFKKIDQKIKNKKEITDYDYLELISTIFMSGTTTKKERIHKIIDINAKYNNDEKLKLNTIKTIINFSKKFFNKKDYEEIRNIMTIKLETERIYDNGIKKGKKKEN